MIIVVLIAVILYLFYLFSTKDHDYWSKRNVKHDRPLPWFGNHLPNVLTKQSMVDVGVYLYNKYPTEKIVGYYRGRTPELIIRDQEIIKRILIADFSYFHSRGGFENPEKEPLIHNLFFMNGGEWKLLRQNVTGTFTSSKLKSMFPLMLKCTEKLQDVTAKLSRTNTEIDVYELMARYTMECIGSCGFGIDLDTCSAEYSIFLKDAITIFNRTKWTAFWAAFEELYPEWTMIHTVKLINKNLSDMIIDITKKVIDERGSKPIGRNDFMDILLKLGQKGKLTMESPYERNEDGTPKKVELEMDLKCIAAQVFVTMLAGFETSATSTSFTLHQLAFNPDIQKRIQQEIDQVLSKYNNRLTFDAVGEMKLLTMAFQESLRMLPPGALIRRKCMRKYTIPGTDVTIDPRVRILIPVQGLHMNPDVFDNPTEYRPERFAPDAKKISKFEYIPFGEGPRKCPGYRLGYTQSLAGLATVLHKFSVIPGPNSRRQYTVKKTSYSIQVVEGGIPLILVSRSTNT